MSTIKDVAKHTGLSISTISKCINGGNVLEENRQLIEEAIDLLNFKPNNSARALKTNKTMTIGVLIPSLQNVFFTKIVSYIEDFLQDSNYGIIISDFKEDGDLERKKLQFLLDKNVDGIIMVSYGNTVDMVKDLVARKFPIILLDHMIKGVDVDVVIADNLNAMYTATEELIKRHHKNIGIVCGPEDAYTALERKKGYLRVHGDYDLDVNDDYIKASDYTVDGGYNAFKALMSLENRPTAVVVTNYEMTIGTIMAVNDLGIKIPDEVSLIGFDNIQMAKVVRPPLSLVEQPMEKIAEIAANLIMERLAGQWNGFPSVNRLKTNVCIKESVSHL